MLLIQKELCSGVHRFGSAPALGGDGPWSLSVLLLYSDLWRNLLAEEDARHSPGHW